MASTATNTFGVITLDGVQYIERPQVFPYEVQITQPGQVITNLRLTMPGISNFLLKGLGRDCIANGVSIDRRFRMRMLNSEGSTWFFSSGLGIFNDRVVDPLIFGSAQFPFPIIPPVPVSASSSLFLEFEDMNLPGGTVPYLICLAFYGAYIVPVVGS